MDMVYRTLTTEPTPSTVLHNTTYRNKKGPECAEIDRHRLRTQSSAIDFQIACSIYYVQMGSHALARFLLCIFGSFENAVEADETRL
jgi:hypothetical protein